MAPVLSVANTFITVANVVGNFLLVIVLYREFGWWGIGAYLLVLGLIPNDGRNPERHPIRHLARLSNWITTVYVVLAYGWWLAALCWPVWMIAMWPKVHYSSWVAVMRRLGASVPAVTPLGDDSRTSRLPEVSGTGHYPQPHAGIHDDGLA
jgi:hypothetical protein